jgi:serine/threonine-protein kinase RsbW
MAPASPGYSAHLQVASSLTEVEQVLGWFEGCRRAAPGAAQLPERLWLEAQMALVEGFTNVVRHAHRGLEPAPAVQLDLELSPQVLELRVTDAGAPFDLAAAWERLAGELAAPAHDPLEREAHWGLILLLKLQQERGWRIDYRPADNGGNVLRLQHSFDAAAAEVALPG